MPLYLGCDCSTQGLTAIVVEIADDVRRIVFQSSLNFDRDFPAYGTTGGVCRGADETEVFASPLMWADALDRMMARIARTAELDLDNLRAICGSAQQHASVYLNRTASDAWRSLDPSSALAPQLAKTLARERSPVWMDATTGRECREIEEALGGAAEMAALTGSPACERFTGPQIRRFHQQQPDAYAATTRIHLASSYLASLLAGKDAPIDPGDGSGMNLMDLVHNRWSPEALDATAPGLAERLPPIAPSWEMFGRLSAFWQKRYSLPPIPLVPWTGDNPSSLVGTGIIRDGVLAVSLGTSDTVFTCTATPARNSSHVFRAPTCEFMNLVCFRNGSLAREWVRIEHRLDWGAVAKMLEQSPGNEGRLMLPWLEAEITPRVAHPGLRRFAFNQFDAAANVRGLIEGQLMAIANHAADVTTARIDRVIATGGAAVNRSILQVMANVFGVDVYRLDVENSAALGAALRAYHADRLASGEPVSWKTVVSGFTDPNAGHRVAPNPKLVAMYATLRHDYAIAEQLHKSRAPIC
ncbi:MAG TPA: FGGY-family carbohydrate kinase [Vicinamibacterales bacterium]|nr:FGGY-family carbohydrate kinase [Vicinamibacterales bacterium]